MSVLCSCVANLAKGANPTLMHFYTLSSFLPQLEVHYSDSLERQTEHCFWGTPRRIVNHHHFTQSVTCWGIYLFFALVVDLCVSFDFPLEAQEFFSRSIPVFHSHFLVWGSFCYPFHLVLKRSIYSPIQTTTTDCPTSYFVVERTELYFSIGCSRAMHLSTFAVTSWMREKKKKCRCRRGGWLLCVIVCGMQSCSIVAVVDI